MKLVIIGGASAYTPDIIDGLLNQQEVFDGWDLVLHDVDSKHLAIVDRLARKMTEAAGARLRITATLDRAEALEGARFILTQPRVGGLPARERDERIALEHGVIGQETLGAGGMSFAWRTIPLMVEIVQEALRLAPDAWVINYANPCGMVTEAVLQAEPDARFIGLCDMPTGVQWAIGKLMRVDFHQVALDYQGINHGGWSQAVLLHGEDILPRLRRYVSWLPPWIIPKTSEESGALRLFRRYGLIPDPYLRYYYFKDAMLAKLQRKGTTRAREVMDRLPDLYRHYDEASREEVPVLSLHRGHTSHSDLASQVIAAMASGRRARFVIQQRNGGAVPGLPADRQAQFPAVVGPDGFERIPMPEMPDELTGLLRTVKESETLNVAAALNGDRDKAVQAMEGNPLVGKRTLAQQLVDAYLRVHREYLPQFR